VVEVISDMTSAIDCAAACCSSTSCTGYSFDGACSAADPDFPATCCYLKNSITAATYVPRRAFVSGLVRRPNLTAGDWSPFSTDALLVQLAALKQRMETSQAHAAQYQVQIQAANDEFLNVTSTVAGQRAELSMMVTAFESLQLRQKAAIDAREHLKAQQASLEVIVRKDDTILEQVAQQVADASSLRDTELGRQIRLQAAVNVVKTGAEAATIDAANLKAEMEDLSTQEDTLEDSIHKLVSSADQGEEDLKRTMLEALQARLNAAAAREESMSTDLQDKLVDFQDTVGSLQTQQAQLQGSIDAANIQLSDAQNRATTAEGALSVVQLALSSTKGNITEKTAALANAQVAYEATKSKAADFQRRVTNVVAAARVLQTRGITLQNRQDTAANQTIFFTARHDALTAELAAHDQQLVDAQNTFHVDADSYASLQNNFTAVQAILADVTYKEHAQAATLAMLQKQKTQLQREVTTTRSAVAAKKLEVNELHEQVEAARTAMFAIQQRIKSRSAAAAALAGNIDVLLRRGECDPSAVISGECDPNLTSPMYREMLDAVANGRAPAA
jgi:chromosome segregation ATPase